MITFIDHLDDYLCGTNITLLDCYKNLLKLNIDCELKIHYTNLTVASKYTKLFKLVSFIKQISKENMIVKDDIIITTLYTLKQKSYKIKCDKLIILDSLDFLMCHNQNILDDLYYEISKTSNEIIVLANPFNFQFIKYDVIEYYHKFDFDRIKKLATTREVGPEYIQNREQIINPFMYKKFNYERYFKVGDGYYENICKIIYEFNYLNKIISYSPKNKTCDDGLTYYLKLFDIDDNKEQLIKIEKELIIDKLGFFKNDNLIELVNL
jgi:hypothetical protein